MSSVVFSIACWSSSIRWALYALASSISHRDLLIASHILLILSKRGGQLDVQRALGIIPGDRVRDFDRFPGLIPYLRLHRQIHSETLGEASQVLG